jgi:hypothetical protein
MNALLLLTIIEGNLMLNAIILVVTGLNTLGVFALLFKAGKYVGETDTRLDVLEDTARRHDGVAQTLIRQGERLARLEAGSAQRVNGDE